MAKWDIRSTAKMPDKTAIQLENWEESYRDRKDLWWCIGAYPIAKRNSGRPFGPKKGRIFRLTINFVTESEATEAFDKLRRGEATLLDYSEQFWYGDEAFALIKEGERNE